MARRRARSSSFSTCLRSRPLAGAVRPLRRDARGGGVGCANARRSASRPLIGYGASRQARSIRRPEGRPPFDWRSSAVRIRPEAAAAFTAAGFSPIGGADDPDHERQSWNAAPRPFDDIRALITANAATGRAAAAAARERDAQLTKPPGSLGRLEEIWSNGLRPGRTRPNRRSTARPSWSSRAITASSRRASRPIRPASPRNA